MKAGWSPAAGGHYTARMANGPDPAKTLSPKVTASALAAALSTLLWFVLTKTVVEGLTDAEVAAVTGATATVLAFLLGYIVKDPLRQ